MAKVIVHTYNVFDEPEAPLVYEGDIEVGMNQGNALVVSERVPDVSGKGGPDKAKVIALINSTTWAHAEVE